MAIAIILIREEIPSTIRDIESVIFCIVLCKDFFDSSSQAIICFFMIRSSFAKFVKIWSHLALESAFSFCFHLLSTNRGTTDKDTWVFFCCPVSFSWHVEVEQVCSVIDSGSENLCERALHQTTYITELPVYHSMDLHKKMMILANWSAKK